MPEAGWYQDPTGKAPFRWWDGQTWLEEVTDNPNLPPSFHAQEEAPSNYYSEPTQDPYTQNFTQNPFSSEPEQNQYQQNQYQQNPFGSQSPFAQQEASPYENNQPAQSSAPWDTVGTTSSDPYGQQASPLVNQRSMWDEPSFDPQENTTQYESSLDETVATNIGVGKLPWEVEEGEGEEIEEESFFEQKKKFILVGVGAFVALLLIYFVFLRGGGGGTEESPDTQTPTTQAPSGQSDTGGSQPGGQSDSQAFQVTELQPWSLWLNTYGFGVGFPTPPQLQEAADRRILTSFGEGYQYQLVERYLGKNDVAAATVEQRLDILNQLLAESEPSATVESATGASLGGIPGREFVLVKEDGSRYSALASFTADRLFLLIGQGGEAERFYDSFIWFKQPEFAPPAPQ